MSRARIDETGKRYGRLVVAGPAARAPSGDWLWRCVCDCGAERVERGWRLRNLGDSASCGCAKPRHLMSHTPTYKSWRGALERASSTTKRYAHITICDRWRTFENFLADMGERPPGKTIDRIDNAKGYGPGNCRWATPREQAVNRGSTILITVGDETLPAADWARRIGLSSGAMCRRLHGGWPVEEAVTTPPLPSGGRRAVRRNSTESRP